jgi:hypothetical protein
MSLSHRARSHPERVATPPGRNTSAWVFNPLVDRLLRLRRGDRLELLAKVRAALDHFPDLARYDQAQLLRRIVASDAANRLVFRLGAWSPRLARAIARLVPIAGRAQHFRDAPRERPIVIALMHFGPIHFACAVLVRLMHGRRLFILQAGGEFGEKVRVYLAGIGAIPIVTTRDALATLRAEMSRDPFCAVVVAFDHFSGRRRRSVPFLGATVSAPTGLAYLAAQTQARVIAARLEVARGGPRLLVGERFEADGALDPAERTNDLHDRLFRMLESEVRRSPGTWTEWRNCLGT